MLSPAMRRTAWGRSTRAGNSLFGLISALMFHHASQFYRLPLDFVFTIAIAVAVDVVVVVVVVVINLSFVVMVVSGLRLSGTIN